MSTWRQWEQLATEAIADAGEWKAETRRLQAVNAEMLEALQTLMKASEEWTGYFRDTHPARIKARAAIAKATGGGK